MLIQSHHTVFNADLYTPVEIYLSLRNKYRKVCLLESNDYHSRQDSKSFIGFQPLLEITLVGKTVRIHEGQKTTEHQLSSDEKQATQLQRILSDFEFDTPRFNGFFGRASFELTLTDETHLTHFESDLDLPTVHLFIFQYVIVIDHFTNEGIVIENSTASSFQKNTIDDFVKKNHPSSLPFELVGEEIAQYSDAEFAKIVSYAQNHVRRGDVFQLVVSNGFKQAFFGDDFQVYRQLRRLNPSPYLFYFDFEEYRLFGSSPEAQLSIKNGIAEIHPIAGTVPKTGNEVDDAAQLAFLLQDEKENAEHTMLVDLARNDLSKDCAHVRVETYKEVQHFSHVTHLVSKVTGKLTHDRSFEALTNSFPAGTLSGTPKPRALELIQQYESTSRDFYGGTIGLIGANGELTTAIVIRSFLSKEHVLHYRAGAGVVLDSQPEKEVQEVHHKLRALRKALTLTAAHYSSTNAIL